MTHFVTLKYPVFFYSKPLASLKPILGWSKAEKTVIAAQVFLTSLLCLFGLLGS